MNRKGNGQEINLAQIDLRRATAAERLLYGKQIKQLRLVKGLKQEELAEAAGVARRTVGSIERGEVAGQAEKLSRLLLVLGVDSEPATWSDFTEQHLAIIAPLIEALPESVRSRTMNEVLRTLATAIQPPKIRPDLAALSEEELERLRPAASSHEDVEEADHEI